MTAPSIEASKVFSAACLSFSSTSAEICSGLRSLSVRLYLTADQQSISKVGVEASDACKQ